MSFVIPRERRNQLFRSNPTPTPAPNQYSFNSPYPSKHAYAPFGSLRPKSSAEDKVKQPGPGHYQVVRKQSKGGTMVGKRQRFSSSKSSLGPGPCQCSDSDETAIIITGYINRKKKLKKKSGPGDYQISVIQRKAKCVVKWSRPKQPVPDFIIPHKKDQKAVVNKKKEKQSHMFLSRTGRQTFSFVRLQQQQIQQNCSVQKKQTEDKTIIQKDYSFGSKLQRNLEWGAKNQNPGPGHYNKNINTSHSKKRSHLRPSMKSQTKRSQQQQPIGPGYYNTNNDQLKHKLIEKYYRGYKGNFCTTAPRFKTSVQEPHQDFLYSLDHHARKNQNKAKINQVLMRNSNRWIKSRTKSQNQRREIDNFGKYDLNGSDLSVKIKKKVQYIKNLQDVNIKIPGFGSSHPRFPRKKMLSVKENFIPLEMLLLRISEEKRQRSVGGVWSQQPRWVDRVQQGPSVGFYNIEESKLEKKSFNVNYGFSRRHLLSQPSQRTQRLKLKQTHQFSSQLMKRTSTTHNSKLLQARLKNPAFITHGSDIKKKQGNELALGIDRAPKQQLVISKYRQQSPKASKIKHNKFSQALADSVLNYIKQKHQKQEIKNSSEITSKSGSLNIELGKSSRRSKNQDNFFEVQKKSESVVNSGRLRIVIPEPVHVESKQFQLKQKSRREDPMGQQIKQNLIAQIDLSEFFERMGQLSRDRSRFDSIQRAGKEQSLAIQQQIKQEMNSGEARYTKAMEQLKSNSQIKSKNDQQILIKEITILRLKGRQNQLQKINLSLAKQVRQLASCFNSYQLEFSQMVALLQKRVQVQLNQAYSQKTRLAQELKQALESLNLKQIAEKERELLIARLEKKLQSDLESTHKEFQALSNDLQRRINDSELQRTSLQQRNISNQLNQNSLKSQIKQLKSLIEYRDQQKARQIGQLQNQRNAAIQRLRDFQSNNLNIRPQFQKCKNNLEAMRQKLGILQTENRHLEEKIMRLQVKLKNQQDERDKLQSKSNNNVESIDYIRKIEDKLKADSALRMKQQTRIIQLQSTIDELKENQRQLRRKLDMERSKKDKLLGEIEAQKANIFKRIQNFDQSEKSHRSQFKQKLEEGTFLKRRPSIGQYNPKNDSEVTAQLMKLIFQNKDIQATRRAQDEEMNNLKIDLQIKKRNLSQKIQKIFKQEREIQQYKRIIDSLQTQRKAQTQKLDILAKSSQELSKTIDTLSNNGNKQDIIINNLRVELEQAYSQLSQRSQSLQELQQGLQRAMDKIKELQSSVQKKSRQTQQQRQDNLTLIQQLETYHKDFEQYQDKIRKLNKQIKDINQRHQQQLDNSKKELQNLTQSNQTLRLNKQTLQEALSILNTEYELLQSNNFNLMLQNDTVLSKYQHYKTGFDQSNKLLEEAQSRLEAASRFMTLKEKQVSELAQDRALILNKMNQTYKELVQSKQKAYALEQSNDRLSKQVDEHQMVRLQNKNLLQNLMAYKEEIESLNDENANSKAQLIHKEEETRSLEAALQKLRAQFHSLKNQHEELKEDHQTHVKLRRSTIRRTMKLDVPDRQKVVRIEDRVSRQDKSKDDKQKSSLALLEKEEAFFSSIKQQLLNFNNEIEILRKQFTEETNSRTQEELSVLKCQILDLKQELKRLNIQNSQLNKQIIKSHNQRIQLNNELVARRVAINKSENQALLRQFAMDQLRKSYEQVLQSLEWEKSKVTEVQTKLSCVQQEKSNLIKLINEQSEIMQQSQRKIQKMQQNSKQELRQLQQTQEYQLFNQKKLANQQKLQIQLLLLQKQELTDHLQSLKLLLRKKTDRAKNQLQSNSSNIFQDKRRTIPSRKVQTRIDEDIESMSIQKSKEQLNKREEEQQKSELEMNFNEQTQMQQTINKLQQELIELKLQNIQFRSDKSKLQEQLVRLNELKIYQQKYEEMKVQLKCAQDNIRDIQNEKTRQLNEVSDELIELQGLYSQLNRKSLMNAEELVKSEKSRASLQAQMEDEAQTNRLLKKRFQDLNRVFSQFKRKAQSTFAQRNGQIVLLRDQLFSMQEEKQALQKQHESLRSQFESRTAELSAEASAFQRKLNSISDQHKTAQENFRLEIQSKSACIERLKATLATTEAGFLDLLKRDRTPAFLQQVESLKSEKSRLQSRVREVQERERCLQEKVLLQREVSQRSAKERRKFQFLDSEEYIDQQLQ